MKSNNIKTHFDRNVFLTFLVLFLVGLIMVSFKINSKVDCGNPDFKIISNSFTTEDLIEFNSIDDSGVEWEWDFGDKTSTKYQSNVAHQFKIPGTYKIALKVNGQCNVVKEIKISKKKELISPELIPNINLPINVKVGEEVVFSSDATFAESWQWSFGESLYIDGTDKEVKYTFKSPGEKTILLVVNGDRLHESRRKITVLDKRGQRTVIKSHIKEDPIQKTIDALIPDSLKTNSKITVPAVEAPPAVKKINVSSDEILQMLVGYSERRIDDRAIREYFTYNSIPVFNESGKRREVSELFKFIRDQKMDVKSLKLKKDQKTGKINSMTIEMKIKKGLFSKNF
ncbi:PKD domain containing protein [Cellulophaga algicola DSM 14237]|uniref:PKD domain containing protein n=1 Tax=Cellulophaga algicola (strain DSM 14237 / IC166 / ACAM 630) TaxID=688270 RepID=E6XAN5_CELAD|nr:PKD domain-containing protein [Cellulophaga algicola]ADV50997.1 PKD domain containing protein [Cellulophaga algicola DSM 14237]